MIGESDVPELSTSIVAWDNRPTTAPCDSASSTDDEPTQVVPSSSSGTLGVSGTPAVAYSSPEVAHPLPSTLGTLLVNVQSASDNAIWQTPSPHTPSEPIAGPLRYYWNGDAWTERAVPLTMRLRKPRQSTLHSNLLWLRISTTIRS